MAVQPSESSTPQLPELVTNPLASVAAAPCIVRLASNVTVTVPALSAAEWLELLMGEVVDLDLVLPGLLTDDEQEMVNELLLDGKLTLVDLERRALEVVAEVSGRPWWVALRMIQLASLRWSILGTGVILTRVDTHAVPLGAWLDTLWHVIFQSLPQDQWTMMSSMIEALPESEMPEDPMEALEMSADVFAQFMRD